jgi:hypothetical protein
MDHAQKRALQGTNEVSGLGLRSLRLPPYTPALFLARCAAIFVTYPAQNLIRTDSLTVPDVMPRYARALMRSKDDKLLNRTSSSSLLTALEASGLESR